MACAIYVDVEDENSLMYTEEWETQEALGRRLGIDNLRVLLSALDLAPTPPVVRFDMIGDTRGMELIAEARGQVEGGSAAPSSASTGR